MPTASSAPPPPHRSCNATDGPTGRRIGVTMCGLRWAAMDRGIHRIAVVNRGEAAMRLINAVRELRYESIGESPGRDVCGPPGDRPAHPGGADGDVRAGGRRSRLSGRRPCGGRGQSVPRPRRVGAGPRGGASRCGVGRLGVRGRAAGIRRIVRSARRRVHRAVGERDARTGRQDRGQAPRGAIGCAGRAMERRARGVDRRGAEARRGDRLPADDQGHRGRRRSRHPQGGRRGRVSPRRSRVPAPKG